MVAQEDEGEDQRKSKMTVKLKPSPKKMKLKLSPKSKMKLKLSPKSNEVETETETETETESDVEDELEVEADAVEGEDELEVELSRSGRRGRGTGGRTPIPGRGRRISVNVDDVIDVDDEEYQIEAISQNPREIMAVDADMVLETISDGIGRQAGPPSMSTASSDELVALRKRLLELQLDLKLSQEEVEQHRSEVRRVAALRRSCVTICVPVSKNAVNWMARDKRFRKISKRVRRVLDIN